MTFLEPMRELSSQINTNLVELLGKSRTQVFAKPKWKMLNGL